MSSSLDFLDEIRKEPPENEWEVIRSKALETMIARIKIARVRVFTERLCKSLCDLDHGSETGATSRRCREAFQCLLLRQRVIHNIKSPDVEVEVLGRKISTPIMFAPVNESIKYALFTELNKSAFIEMSKAAAKANTIVWIGYPVSRHTLKKVVRKKFCPLIWIIKPLKNREEIAKNIEFAERIGLFAVGVDLDSAAGLSAVGDKISSARMRVPLSIDELKSLREKTSLPFIVKGVMSREDVEASVKAGANAIVVSNHGGHALDYSRASIEVLPDIKESVGNKVEIYLDSGVRRGTDILKALALGANAILIGRVMLWGLAIGEAEGAYHVLSLLTEELSRNMILTGVKSASEVPSEIIYRPT